MAEDEKREVAGRLVELAFIRLDDQNSEIRDRRTQALGGLAAAVALATALLGIRAQATSEVLKAVPGLRDWWWIPLIPFALSAGLFLYATVMPARVALPDPEREGPYLAAAPSRQLLLFLATLGKAHDLQRKQAFPQAVVAQIGVGVLAIALGASLVVFLGVR